jgi:hypothetical protein
VRSPWSTILSAVHISNPQAGIEIFDCNSRNFEEDLYEQIMDPSCLPHVVSATFRRTVIRSGSNSLN